MKKLLLSLIFFLQIVIMSIGYTQERAITHSPISIMGDHMHKSGEFMISLRRMNMNMKGNLNSTKSLTDADIINLPNPYKMGSMPAKLSVVPQKMDMQMTMLGLMFAPSDKVTIMSMAMFVGKDMSLNTYKGMMNREYLGSFNTSSPNDLSSLSISSLVRLTESEKYNSHIQLGFSNSIGSNKLTGIVLTPMNMRKNMILPYGMQLSDKSNKAIISYTLSNKINQDIVTGLQLKNISTIKKQDWSFGDKITLSGWVQKELDINTSISFGIYFATEKKINGRDTSIIAPVQTSNPENYGGDTIDIGLGVNKLFNIFSGEYKDRLAIEVLFPVSQKLNGPQMKKTWSLNIGYQKTFKF